LKSEKKEDVPFGEEVYYGTIIQKDAKGLDYFQQRDAWREGTDFSFAAEFYAKIASAEEEDEPSQVVDVSNNSTVVDTDLVE
jgi:hypothetical protein